MGRRFHSALAVFLLGSPTAALPATPSDFVEVAKLDPTIVIELPYATEDNFCKTRLYPVERCFLRREVAGALVAAHRSLAERGLGLKIWDGYRPHSVQFRMWEVSPLPDYVGDPKRGSKHNRGAAVDVTLVDLATGEEVEMPTPYDEFSPRAHTGYFKVSDRVAENRKILQTAMRAQGFTTIPSEWWHFDYRGWERFPLSDVSLVELGEQSDARDWPRFRGHGASGIAADSDIPLEWSATQNLKWKLDLPGPGSSSPITWGNRVFITSYSGYGDGKGGTDPLALARHLHCADLETGKLLWTASETALLPEDRFEGYLVEHGYASSTPATDGERIYCFHGKNGVFAYDFLGRRVWSAPTGTMSSSMVWGSAASVVVSGESVIINAGDEARAVLALDRRTGKELWRMEHPLLEQTYNTPVVHRVTPERDDLVVAFRGEIRGLDPATGAVRWFSKSPVTGNLSGSPVVLSGNRLALFSGFPRTLGTVFTGGGAGDRSEGADRALLWESPQASSYLPMPVEHGDLLHWVSESGIACCARPESGELLYRERLDIASEDGRGMAFYASPIRVGDHLVAVSRNAGTYILKTGPAFALVRVNRIEDDRTRFHGTPAVAGGRLLLRSEKALYAIGR